VNTGGDRAHNSAKSTYWSCHSTIRTHILNWRQSCRNRKFGTAVQFQPGQIPAVLSRCQVITRQDTCGSGNWPGLEPNQTKLPVKTRTAGGLPGPVANTTYNTTGIPRYLMRSGPASIHTQISVAVAKPTSKFRSGVVKRCYISVESSPWNREQLCKTHYSVTEWSPREHWPAFTHWSTGVLWYNTGPTQLKLWTI